MNTYEGRCPFSKTLAHLGRVGGGLQLLAGVVSQSSQPTQTSCYAGYVTALRFLRSSRLPHAEQCVIRSVYVSLVSRSSKNIQSYFPPVHQNSAQIWGLRS